MGRLTRFLADLRVETLDVCRRALGPRFDEDTDRYEAYLEWREHACDDPRGCSICLRLVRAIRWNTSREPQKEQLQRLAVETGKPIATLKRDALLTGLWLALADDSCPQKVRIGGVLWATLDAENNVIFRTTRPDLIEPAGCLGDGTGDYVAWFRAAAINHAEADIANQLSEWDQPSDALDSHRRSGLPAGDDGSDPHHFNLTFADPASLELNDATYGRGHRVTGKARTLIRPVEPAGGEQAIRKPLSDMERRIFGLLKTEPNLSHAAIAARLGTTRETVKKARARIRAKGWGASN